MFDNKLRTLIARELQLPAEKLGPDAAMETLEQWDSIAHINICLAIQAEYGIDMSVDEITECTSSSTLAALLERKLGQTAR